jgi:hypothetical protein
MLDVYLIRYKEDPDGQGVAGFWVTSGFRAFTIELPWKNNAPDVSCIPDGVYRCKAYASPRFGIVYHITDVAGRTWILTHYGNWAGDTEKGWRSNSNGCVIMGKDPAEIYGQMAVATSKTTLRKWMEFTGGEDFMLHIISIDRERQAS